MVSSELTKHPDGLTLVERFIKSCPRGKKKTNIRSNEPKVPSPAKVRFRADGSIPFIYTSKRASTIFQTPSPATYTIKYRKNKILGVSSPRNRTPRNIHTHKPGPSPLSYDVDEIFIHKPIGTIPGKLCLGKPPRYGCVMGYSVPDKLFNGFDIEEDGSLIRRPPRGIYTRKSESEPVPFPYELNGATRKYKGFAWSRRSTARKPVYAADTRFPGPGLYDLLDKPLRPQQIWDEKVREKKRATSNLHSRTHEKNDRVALREDLPGPGSYLCNFDAVYKQRSFNKVGTFTRGKRNTLVVEDDIDNPLIYNVPPLLDHRSHQFYSCPFNSSVPRITGKPLHTYPVGPGCYYPMNYTVEYKLEKKLPSIYAARSAPFNTTSLRRSDFSDEEETPGPGDYSLEPPPPRPIYDVRNKYSAIPAVVLKPLQKYSDKYVTPLTYNTKKALRAQFYRCEHHKGPTWVKSNSNRFEWLIKKNTDALYAWEEYQTRQMRDQPPFGIKPKEKTKEVPGPDAYQIHPLYSNALVRASCSHNVTLGVHHPSAETLYRSKPARRHFLRCFVKYPKD